MPNKELDIARRNILTNKLRTFDPDDFLNNGKTIVIKFVAESGVMKGVSSKALEWRKINKTFLCNIIKKLN